MRKREIYLLAANILASLFCVNCGNLPPLEVDLLQLQENIYDPSAVRCKMLESSTALYLDHSTCVIDARQNSPVFNALLPQLGQYSDTLRLIKGDNFETIPLNRSDNQVFRVLETIREDIPYSNILKAAEQICNSNQQAIVITDCEFISNGLCHDRDPYLSEPFKRWLQKGYVIYVVTEPYKEKTRGRTYDKKRFYLIFTDDKLEAPISNNMFNELRPYINSAVSIFKLVNSDLRVTREGDLIESDLTFIYEGGNGFDYVEIDNDWDDIREYVMKLDKYGEPLPDDEGKGDAKPLPIIKNLIFNEGENYVIKDVEVVAANITAQYLALSDSLFTVDVINIPDGFMIDKDALRKNRINVMLTDRIFNYLTDEWGGNLLRLDIVITQTGLKPYDASVFTWQSLYNSTEAICVAKSIDNALRDVEVLPTYKDRRTIHTVFLKTQSYN